MPQQGQIWTIPFLDVGRVVPGQKPGMTYELYDHTHAHGPDFPTSADVDSSHQATNSDHAVSCLMIVDIKDTHNSPNSAYTGPAISDACTKKSASIPSFSHQPTNGDYTVSSHDSHLINETNSDYTVSTHSTATADTNMHQEPNSDYTVSCTTLPTSDQSSRGAKGPADPDEHNLTLQVQLGILSKCNLVQVEASTLANIRHMVSTAWPLTTKQAWKDFPEFAAIYNALKSYNMPNFAGARIPVSSGLKVPNWVALLQNFQVNEICHFLQFGWPLGYYSDSIPSSVQKNHPSALA